MRVVRGVAIAVGMAVIAGAMAAFLFIRANGFAADRAPGAVETAVASRLLWLSIPASARNAPNPYARDPEAWREGAEHFGEHCATCHGRDGRGGSEIGRKMYPPVPDLASPRVQRLSDGALFSIIQHGVRWTGMPAFQSSHTPEETWRLVSFVRRVPRLTPADLDAARDHGPAHDHGSADDPDRAHEHGDEAHDAATTVSIDGTAFDPHDVTVKVGQTVRWTNKDPFPHTVSSTSGAFRSGAVQPDESWTFHATARGTFPYVCTLHPGMAGVLHVE
jgi:plastocyanin/mono/diheme cytochrome c family protein